MDYTNKDGIFYKVEDKETEAFIMSGKLKEDSVLSTIHTVTFLTEEEYVMLTTEPELQSPENEE